MQKLESEVNQNEDKDNLLKNDLFETEAYKKLQFYKSKRE